MTIRNVFMAGLPDAGKTTFIAALWYLVFSKTPGLDLQYDSIDGLELDYMNVLKRQWLQAEKLERTKIGLEQTAVINLKGPEGGRLALSLEDFAGEGFRQMWVRRRASAKIVDQAQRADRFLLMINIGKVIYPQSVAEFRQQLSGLPAGIERPFDAKKCPTAAQVTDVLQHLLRSPINAKPQKIAVALTAWDEVAGEGSSPKQVLRERLPLVAQYLDALSRDHQIKLYGLSAQGASYDDEAQRTEILEREPLDRIQLIEEDGSEPSHDLTRMLAWLLD